LGTAFGVSLNNNLQKDDPADDNSGLQGHEEDSEMATHKTAQKTKEGAQKVEDRTNSK
jgi:hypothetical protein